MSQPSNYLSDVAAEYSEAYHQPSALSRYAKLAWVSAGVVLTMLTTITSYFVNYIPPNALPYVLGIIGVLTAAGVARDANAQTPATVVGLVDKFLPNHTLIAKTDTSVPTTDVGWMQNLNQPQQPTPRALSTDTQPYQALRPSPAPRTTVPAPYSRM